MNMTRKEATRILQNGSWWDCLPDDMSDADMNPLQDALDVALSALRPITREQVEKAWRGEWIIPTIIGGRTYNIPHCSACNGVPCGTDEHTRFCAHCGAPMTDEAVQMVMERMEKLKNEIG